MVAVAATLGLLAFGLMGSVLGGAKPLIGSIRVRACLCLGGSVGGRTAVCGFQGGGRTWGGVEAGAGHKHAVKQAGMDGTRGRYGRHTVASCSPPQTTNKML